MSASRVPSDFDPDVYLALHPDVKRAGVDPVAHYLEFGIKEGRAYKRGSALQQELAKFVTIPPTQRNAFDAFGSSWSTRYDGMTQGHFDGTRDARLDWLFGRVNVDAMRILELGPLEAAHTLSLERRGADVVAIEANVGAFLRSLVVKNHFHLRATFILGDFEKMDFASQSYDLVMASGILYHLNDPVAFLRNVSACAPRLFVWTHYFEPDLSKWHASLHGPLNDGKWDYVHPIVKVVDGSEYRYVEQRYGDALGWTGFCGGTDVTSRWMMKDDLFRLLKQLGFGKIEVGFDTVDHPNGPAMCLYCET